MLACLRPSIHPSCSPSVPSSFSSMPDKNVSFCTRGPILCLKSHLHRSHSLCRFSLPQSFLSVWPVLSVGPAPPCLRQLQWGPQTPSLSSSSSTWPDHTCHLHGRQGPGMSATGAFIHSSPCPSEPLIPSSLHPVTEEWPVLRASGQSGCCEDVCFKQSHGESVQVKCVWGWVLSLGSSHISSRQWHPFMAG